MRKNATTTQPPIRLLANSSNKRGDLFAQLIADLFFALGYDQPRLNIQKSGREIDVEAFHRTENRRIIAECKAEAKPIGGADINKFVGVLDAEKRQNRSTTGYFVSLSGFTEPAIQQELDTGGKRVILIDAHRISSEIINSGIIVSKEKAIAEAVKCAVAKDATLVPEETPELLASGIGWTWLIYFRTKGARTHYSLIHADGEALASETCSGIAKLYKSSDQLADLTYLCPTTHTAHSKQSLEDTRKSYFKYLAAECGEIQLDGLPADQEVGTRRLRLEKLFVPLFLAPTTSEKERPVLSLPDDDESDNSPNRIPISDALEKTPRMAILAAPGAGKTTLLKRLAVAYAFPDRRSLVQDGLPERKWLPFFIRCRQLDHLAQSPILEILASIPARAEMQGREPEFREIIGKALQSGNALLLIDGLDEISDDCIRLAFIKQLRTFLAMYPAISIVVTSREAGFRVVGGVLSGHCIHYTLAEFNEDDIKRLTCAWHKEIVGDKRQIQQEALKLSDAICSSDRLRRLAQNPLLLTTLLLVKRWVGQLPTKRSVLYGKAIEVLLMTWNVEAHTPLDREEVEPQLAFLAFSMMKSGSQRISKKKLQEILLLARKQMPEVLGYARLSASEFVDQVELRSSLLMLNGHEVEDGKLQPVYEFRHLTFQEYLAAVAIVEGYYPDRKEDDTLLSVMEPHLLDKQWKEVIPLAAVLAGRKVEPLIRRLIQLCDSLPDAKERLLASFYNTQHYAYYAGELLGQCILDDAQISPPLVETGLEWVARRCPYSHTNTIDQIFDSRYSATLYNSALSAYPKTDADLSRLGHVILRQSMRQLDRQNRRIHSSSVDAIMDQLNSKVMMERVIGALTVMEIAYEQAMPENAIVAEENLRKLGDALIPLLQEDDPHVCFAACWAFAWIGHTNLWTPERHPDALRYIADVLYHSDWPEVQRAAAWALSTLPLIPRELNPFKEQDDALDDFVIRELAISEDKHGEAQRFAAAVVIGFYRGKPWSDEELTAIVRNAKGTRRVDVIRSLRKLFNPKAAQSNN